MATLAINGHLLTSALPVNPTGSFIVFLDTAGADPGVYTVAATTGQSAIAGFTLAASGSLRVVEGGGTTFPIAAGIALDRQTYLPLLLR